MINARPFAHAFVLYCSALLASPLSAARAIPGITAKDTFPQGCVSCHVRQPDGSDLRISKLMTRWNGKVDPKALAAMQAFATNGTTLKGKHPPLGAALKDVPGACAKCHRASKAMPPLGPLMHGVHFGGGEKNRFVSVFQGECTHCHKLRQASGTWSLASAPEK